MPDITVSIQPETLLTAVVNVGKAGADGHGVPTGGTTGQVLGKLSGDDFDTEWVDQTGGGSGTVQSVNNVTPDEAGNIQLVPSDIGAADALTSDQNYVTDTQLIAVQGITAHLEAVNNPHETTKSQIGLALVNNTDDLDKPVSTATQSALDLKADLENGLIVSWQLPSYVSEILEYANQAAFPVTGELDKIYLDLSTDPATGYRWSGSVYYSTGQSVSLGETDTTAYRGDRGKTAYDHSQIVNSLYASTYNPHGLQKSDIGLNNVDNIHDADKPISDLTQAALDLKADLVAGVVPSSQLPSYVDDALEYANLAAFPATGTAGKIYVALDTNVNYRWSGTQYTPVSISLALGETSSTAGRGDHAKLAYDHTLETGNVHNMSTSEFGLGNVDNIRDADKQISNLTQAALNTKVDKINGKGLSVNDYTNIDKAKVAAMGTASGLDVGTTAGTVCAGDDSRITGALPKSGGTMTGDINAGNYNISALKTATFNGEVSTGATSGSIALDFTTTLAYVQAEPVGAITYTWTLPAGPCRFQIRIVSDGTSTAQTINLPTVKQYGVAWSMVANKGALLSFWYDGSAVHFMGSNEV